MIQQAAALFQQQDYENAETICKQILDKIPNDSKANHLLGVIYYKKHQFENAIFYLQNATRLAPDNIDAAVALASCLEQSGNSAQAANLFIHTYHRDPSQTNLLFRGCHLLQQIGHTQQALQQLKHFANQFPENSEGLFQLANLQLRTTEIHSAKQTLEQLKKICPDNAELWNLFGLVESRLGNWREAQASFEKGLSLDEGNIQTKLNYASFLQDVGEYCSAKKYYKEIIKSPHSTNSTLTLQKVYYNLALIELGLGNFTESWACLSQRPKKNLTTVSLCELHDKNILIVGEEGLGDELMFLRFIAQLKTATNTISYLGSTKLATVLTDVPVIDHVLATYPKNISYDVVLPLFDLPIILNQQKSNTIPEPLKLSHKQISTQEYTAHTKPIVGLTWRAGQLEQNHQSEKFLCKEIPLPIIKQIFSVFTGTVVVLQRNLQIMEFDELTNALPKITWINATEKNNNLAHMVDTLAQLDAYVGVSNTNMHLFGSLGKQGCVLIPQPGEWRWTFDKDCSPWYPKFTLIRQHNTNWDSLILETKEYLSKLAQEKPTDRSKSTSQTEQTSHGTNNLLAYKNNYQHLIQAGEVKKIHNMIDELRTLDHHSHDLQFQIITDLLQAGYNQEALDLYKNFTTVYGESAIALCNMAVALERLGDYKHAVQYLKKSLQAKPDFIGALNNIVKSLTQLGEFKKAKTYLSQALKLAPNNSSIHINAGRLYEHTAELEKALTHYLRAEHLDAKNPLIKYNLGNVYHTLAKFDQSSLYYQQCLMLDPNFADAEFNLGVNELTCGDFKNGWGHYFKRVRRLDHHARLSPITPGMTLDHKHVHFTSSQGIGDELFFLRFISLIKQRFNNTVISYRPHPKLYDLLKEVDDIDNVLKQDAETPLADYTFAIDDIALLLHINHESKIPPPLVIHPNQELVDKFAALFAKYPKPLTGIVWRAGTELNKHQLPDNQQLLSKQFPLQRLIHELKQLKGTLVILQRNPLSQELATIHQTSTQKIVDLSRLNDNLPEMQAALSLLDDYIGVSNTNVHLMASQGKSGRVLIPSPPEWRWMRQGNSSSWMPNFQLYRQDSTGNWNDAVKLLKTDLKLG